MTVQTVLLFVLLCVSEQLIPGGHGTVVSSRDGVPPAASTQTGSQGERPAAMVEKIKAVSEYHGQSTGVQRRTAPLLAGSKVNNRKVLTTVHSVFVSLAGTDTSVTPECLHHTQTPLRSSTQDPPASSNQPPPPSSDQTPPSSNQPLPPSSDQTPPSSNQTPPPSSPQTPLPSTKNYSPSSTHNSSPSSPQTPPPSSPQTPPPSSPQTPPPSSPQTPPPSSPQTPPPSSPQTPPPSTQNYSPSTNQTPSPSTPQTLLDPDLSFQPAVSLVSMDKPLPLYPGSRAVGSVHTLVLPSTEEGHPDTDPSLRLRSLSGHQSEPGPLSERPPSPPSKEEVQGQQRGLHLVGVKPRSRQKRSWLWNQFFVIEEYRGPEPVLIGRLHTDMDRGDGRTAYLLEGEGVGSVFVIDGRTGNIHVTKALDREEKDQYHLVATATDRQTGRALEPSSQFIIRVQDINDNPPLFKEGPYSAIVPEMANIGTSILQVTASDADDPAYGNSAKLVYAITHGQQYFSVDPQTGILRTAVPDMDRETRDEYLVVLEAKDMGGHLGGLSGTTTVTVRLSDVNDNPPRFRKGVWSFSVSELAAPGVEVGRLSASDADLGENALLDYTILEGEEGDFFNISGRDQEAVIVLNKLLDYETRSSFSFSVEVTNPVVDARFLRQGPFKDRATVRVMVLNADEPPRFSRIRYRMDVSENCPPVCSVGRVSAVDPDTGQGSNIRYSIDPQSDPEALFRIASDSGFITTVMELDRELEQWHNITVIATQRDNPNLVSRVVVAIETLDQNDNAPELDRQYHTSVCDSSPPGQVVQILRAVDKDQGGQDSSVHFSIPPDSSSALNLTVRETGGTLASLVLQSSLQPLPGPASSLLTLYVPIVLRDGASGLTNTGTVTVTVCPCLRGGMRAEERGRQRDRGWERHTVCLPLPSASPSLIFSMVTLLALLACLTTLLVVCALSLSLRHQKGDSLSPQDGDDVRENIITYDDEGGGEADTAAFDITALQSMQRVQRIHDSRNIWYTQQTQPRARTYSCSRDPSSALGPRRPGSAPVYGRLCYGVHTLPTLPDYRKGPLHAGLQLSSLAYELPPTPMGDPLILPSRATFDLLESGAQLLSSGQMGSSVGGAEPWLPSFKPSERPGGTRPSSDSQQDHDQELNKTQPESALTNQPGPATPPDPTASSSSQSHCSSSSHQEGSQPEASLSQTNTAASSSALDETDTESSVPSVPERPGRGTSQRDVLAAHDTYSIVGSLNQGGGGIPATGTTLYCGGAELLNMYGLQRRDLTPQLLPLPETMLGYGRGWGSGRGLLPEGAGPGSNLLPLSVEDFLKFRLNQVTFDLSQPPYDSLQTYEFEGGDSRAESLSSLESDGGRVGEKVVEGSEGLNQKFNRLVEIIQEREEEKEKGLVGTEGDVKEVVDTSQTHDKEREEIESGGNKWEF